MTELWVHGLVAAASGIRAGMFTPIDLVDALLERIDALDDRVQAWVRIPREEVRAAAAARAAEARSGTLRGPLHGVPIAVKDNIPTAGLEMNAGSELLAGFVPQADAPVVDRLRAAGAIVLGKTAMTVFAAMDPAPTRNPWNLAHTPGGSSSGSAAAVAAFLAPAALGSQTAGSIIRPAAYCGVVGLKPTYGAVERTGVFPCAWSMDHVGPITRSIDDAALLFRVLTGQGSGAPAPSMPSREDAVRVGVPDRYFLDNADDDTLQAFEAGLDALRAGGARVEPLALPSDFEAGVDAGIVTMYAEMAAVHRDRFAVARDRYPWRLACLLEAGERVTASQYLHAQRVRREAARSLSAMLEHVDCLVTPSTPSPAPAGLSSTGDWTCNLPFSSSGHPALSVPMGLSGAGLPMGMQFVGRYAAEERLFACGRLLERAMSLPTTPAGVA